MPKTHLPLERIPFGSENPAARGNHSSPEISAAIGRVERGDQAADKAVNEPEEGRRPSQQGHVNEHVSDGEQKVQTHRAHHLERADRVHTERKDRAPIQRIVPDREFTIEMPPNDQDDEHRDPPGSGRPKEDREPLEKGEQCLKEGRIHGILNQDRAGERRDGHRPHVDPVRGREIGRRELEKRVAIEDQRDNPEVHHPATQPHREGDEIDM
jgi:hypothetical protein